MSNEDAVRVDIDGAIITITLNRPDAMHALNQDIYYGLQKTAMTVKENPAIRVVIITGAGERAFSTGQDLKMVAAGDNSRSIMSSTVRGTTVFTD